MWREMMANDDNQAHVGPITPGPCVHEWKSRTALSFGMERDITQCDVCGAVVEDGDDPRVAAAAAKIAARKARPDYASSDDAIADLAKIKALQDKLEAFDLELLHHGLSDAAYGWDAPAYLEEARYYVDQARIELNGAAKSHASAIAWLQENEAEERGDNGYGGASDPAWSGRNSV